MRIINLEQGLPDTVTAMKKLANQIYLVRSSGVKYAKIIHGYGSGGKGGAIKSACLRELAVYRKRRIIKDYCSGERFGPFSEEGRRIAANYPEIRKDADWGRSNDGISIIIYK